MNNIIDLVNACEITATNVHMREREVDGTLANDVLLHSAQSGYFSARAALEAAVAALEKDAARYRAIRQGLEVDPDNSGIVVSLIDDFGGETLRNEQADEAIDAAMEAK